MSRILLGLILCLFAGGTASAFDLLKKKDTVPFDFSVWSDTVTIPAQFRDSRAVLPSVIDGTVVFADTIAIDAGAESAFAAALCHVADNLDREHDRIERIDFDNRSFRISQSTLSGSNNTETLYTRCTDFAVGDGRMEYLISDVRIRYREKGLIPRTLPLDKLNPSTNQRHHELVFGMVSQNGDYIDSMKRFIDANTDLRFGHPDLMKGGHVTEGMSPLEVKVLMGAPLQVRGGGQRERWIYDNNAVVIFTDGIVSRFVE